MDNGYRAIPDSLRSIAERWDEIQWPESSLYGYEANGQLFHGNSLLDMASMYAIHKREDFIDARRQIAQDESNGATHTNESRTDFFAAIDGKPWLILSNGDYVKCTFELDELIELPTAENPVPKHYATPTDKIVEHALDATSNAPDEWPSETGEWDDGLPPFGVACEVAFRGEWEPCEDVFCCRYNRVFFKIPSRSKPFSRIVDQVEFRPIETPAQAEEREREEAKKKFCYDLEAVVNSNADISMRQSTQHSLLSDIFDYLNSGGSAYQLKDKSDD